VTEALSHAGIESSDLSVGIDFTKTNEWTGSKSYRSRSLHHIGYGLNPYEQAISIIWKTLAEFDEDNLIPCYGFGDATTHGQHVLSFYPEDRSCNAFEDAMSRCGENGPQLMLAAMTIVGKVGGQYHVLLIFVDGQAGNGTLQSKSIQEKKSVNAIVQPK
ncbi:E3 ubiquitin protein ligase RGLG2-like protein isoform X2, partial [Tanacetum coccineum]